MAKKYSELKAPKQENMSEDIDLDMLDLEQDDDIEAGSGALADFSDDEIMQELKARGLMFDDEQDEEMYDDDEYNEPMGDN